MLCSSAVAKNYLLDPRAYSADLASAGGVRGIRSVHSSLRRMHLLLRRRVLNVTAAYLRLCLGVVSESESEWVLLESASVV